jgi:hypothetical protein
MPKQFYTANNCGTVGNKEVLTYHKRGVYVFNPEFQFFNKKTEYDAIEVEGVYRNCQLTCLLYLMYLLGSACNNGVTPNSGGSKGVYIEDVQAGTSIIQK